MRSILLLAPLAGAFGYRSARQNPAIDDRDWRLVWADEIGYVRVFQRPVDG